MVGMDALSPGDRLKNGSGQIQSVKISCIRNSFHEIDTYTSLKKNSI